MDSKTYIRACALFMFDQGKSTKETTQVISDLYPADAVTERNCARWFAKFRAGDRSLQVRLAVDALKSSIANL